MKKKKVSFFEDIKRKLSDFFHNLNPRGIASVGQKRQKTGSMVSKRRGDVIFYTLLVFLPMVQFCIFYIGAKANSFLLAFESYNPTTGKYAWAGLKNFKTIWDEICLPNSQLQNAIFTSLEVYVLGLLKMPLNLFFPYYIYKKKPGSELFKVVLFLPSILSGMVMALLYQTFVDQALVEIVDKMLGVKIPAMLYESSTRFWAVWFFDFLTGFGTAVLMYTGTMSRIPESVVEAACLDGAGPVREFFSITLPLIAPTVSTFFLLNFTGIFTDQWNLYSFYGSASQSLQTIGYHSFILVAGSGFSTYPLSATIGLYSTIVLVPATLLLRGILNKRTTAESY